MSDRVGAKSQIWVIRVTLIVGPATSGPPRSTDILSARRHVSEWDGPAVLLPRTAQRVSEGLRARGAHRHALQDRHRNRPHEGLAPVELVGLNRVAP